MLKDTENLQSNYIVWTLDFFTNIFINLMNSDLMNSDTN